MDNWTFGFTMLIVGMGGTVAALWGARADHGALEENFPRPRKKTEN